MQDRIARNTPLLPWLRKWHARGAYIAGICTGVAFLAEGGMLDGRQATTHWARGRHLSPALPQGAWRPEQFVTEDGRVLCSGGVYASIDLSLYLVEKFCGHEIALQVRQIAAAQHAAQPSVGLLGAAAVAAAFRREDQADRGVSAAAFRPATCRSNTSPSALGMGPRNFIRRFKAATGRLPGAYIQTLRVSAAKEMLEHGASSIQTVCSKIGYEDIAFFRSLFKRHTGMTPAEYREPASRR